MREVLRCPGLTAEAAATDEGEGRRAVTEPGTPRDEIELVALRGEGLRRWVGQLTRRDGIHLRVDDDDAQAVKDAYRDWLWPFVADCAGAPA